MLAKLFSPSPLKKQAHELYVECVAAARERKFYAEYGVPDTLDGRFEMILVQMYCALMRLRKDPHSGELQQALSEVFFADMDRSLREIGASDTGIGRRIQNISEAYFGRMKAYDARGTALVEAVRKNVFAGKEGNAEAIAAIIEQAA